MMIQRRLRVGLAAGVIALSAPALLAGSMPRSAHYEMEHASVGVAGGVTQSASYETLGMIKTSGVSNERVSSAKYTVEPVTGSASPTVSGVFDWSLY